MRKAKTFYSELGMAGTQPPPLEETQRQQEWRSYRTENREGSGVCPDGSHWLGETIGRPTKVRHLWDWLWVHVWISLMHPKLEVGAKSRQTVRFNQVQLMAIWG